MRALNEKRKKERMNQLKRRKEKIPHHYLCSDVGGQIKEHF